MESTVILIAFIAGLAVRQIGYPPLLGYLLAGFVASALSFGSGAALAGIADTGVLLLLFTIGLKLSIRSLSPPRIWATALIHAVVVVLLTAIVIIIVAKLIPMLALNTLGAAITIAFALSFSSTVFAIKMFDERGDTKSFASSIAIGILVVQDILAVIFLVLMSGQYPTGWSILLLGAPLLRTPLARLLRMVGHGELLLLCGIAITFASAQFFEWLQLKAGLGALLAGMLVAASEPIKARELYRHLASLKNLLLIGFIVQIGYYGLPSLPMIAVATVLAMLVLIRPLLYFRILTWFHLRARTSLLTGASLMTYSEFGLIVAAYAANSGQVSSEWVTTLALAMALSFVLATPINKNANKLYLRSRSWITRWEKSVLPEEHIQTLDNVNTAVLGMGRVGLGAYSQLITLPDFSVIGVEENIDRVRRMQADGINCIHGDATDRDFWERSEVTQCHTILLSLSNHRENLAVVRLAREVGYTRTLAVAVRFPDEKTELEALGCHAYYLYEDVGHDFARSVLQYKGADNDQLGAKEPAST